MAIDTGLSWRTREAQIAEFEELEKQLAACDDESGDEAMRLLDRVSLLALEVGVDPQKIIDHLALANIMRRVKL